VSESEPTGLSLEIPEFGVLHLSELFLDFTGTLSRDGELIDGVAPRLEALSNVLRISVLTADTFGTAREALAGLPVAVRIIRNATEKVAALRETGVKRVAAVGNGRNDVGMVREAALGIAVIGPEGCAGELVRVANVVCRDIRDSLDLLRNPVRLKATLRG
jgi:soluble P-type ATPase